MGRALTHEEFSKKGGKSRSPKKLKAVRKNIVKARKAKAKKKQIEVFENGVGWRDQLHKDDWPTASRLYRIKKP